MTLPERAFAAALSALPGIGPQSLTALLAAWPPTEAWRRVVRGDRAVRDSFGDRALRWTAAAQRLDPADLWQRYSAEGVAVSMAGDDDYPAALADDHAAPPVLFSLGDPACLDGRPRVAVIGTRRCTAAGGEAAASIGRDLAAAGVVVVSGLALGIDGAAHRGALEASAAPPVGVVGSGLDVVYPSSHRRLWRDVASAGALLSEVPLGGRPEPWRFPARNRIIAGLAHALVVVESHASGGAMLTVEEAVMRSRDVLVVPGAPANPAAAGTNNLLIEGALPVRDAADVLVHLALGCPEDVVADVTAPPAAGRSEADAEDPVLPCVDFCPTSTESIVDRCRLSPVEVSLSLHRLEMSGRVRAAANGWWERIR